MQMTFDALLRSLASLFLPLIAARTKFCLVYVLIYLATTVQAFALCDSYRKETVDTFQFTEFCTASIKRPFYRVVDHYFPMGEARIFTFAPSDRKVLCYRYVIEDQKVEHCENYGVSFFRKAYKSGELTTQMVDIFKSPSAVKELYQSERLFAFPRAIESVELERCFVVFADPQRLYIGYDDDNLIELANCLMPLEAYWKRQKTSFK
jgi:hypothetical protein